MSSAKNALSAIGVSLDEAVLVDETIRNRGPRDNRICICGHPMSAHADIAGRHIECQRARMVCKCVKPRAVLACSDTRLFLRKTTGPGMEHALIRGLGAIANKDGEAEWLVPFVCDICSSDQDITVSPITEFGKVSYEPTGHDIFICKKCKEERL